ncbi:MAG TPA: hypothetical protein DFK15_12765 [Butyricimonas sp.]|uniref:Alpha-L-glutamate ligase-related protein ATP-grasp domain-containing protein n=2 Tax=Butyricimonas virosa TaxID=544645 RepID=A0A415QEG8_9BACT|nr:hypothetical protein DWZ68_15190 [Butyricimonas virosa]HAM85195.1 hypothetical protein [Butyricimonas sp.]HCH90147.1 hypothetical protein [Butyricimonas sp.]
MILHFIMGRKVGKIKVFLSFLQDVHKDSRKGYFFLLRDFIRLKKEKGISIEEYSNFKFESRGKKFRDSFLSGVEQRPCLNLLNPKKYYILARNKYLSHLILGANNIRKAELYCYYHPEGRVKNDHIACDYDSVLAILKSKNIHSCVIKSTETSHGDGVIVVNDIEYTDKDCILHLFDGRKVCLKDRLKEYEPLIFESKIYQTKQFDSFNSSSVNTIRFMTTLYPTGDVKIIAIWMKFGRAGVCVDNAGAGGNVDAGVDIKTGRIFNVTLFDEWRETRSITHHPDSGTLLEGVFIENWKQITDEIIQFQKSIPYLKAIGWDIAITPEGPLVVEFNDYWDRTGQLFLGYGWKKEIQDCYKQWKKLEDVGKVSYKMGRL